MRRATSDDSGFTLVEIVVSIVILGLLAVAILPALVIGLKVTADQSGRASVNRHLSTLVDQARSYAAPTCVNLSDIALHSPDFYDGRNRRYTVSGSVVDSSSTAADPVACKPGSAARLELTMKTDAGQTVASVTALVFVPTP